jgi:hypothetical protein
MKLLLVAVIVILIGIQFIRPKLNSNDLPPTADDFIVKYAPPPRIATMLRNACYDCHSNHTRYPWYNRIQPVAWWLASHVNDGKRSLNFSIFGQYDAKRKSKKLDQIADQVNEHDMPLSSYTWIHADARLSDKDRNELTDWIDALQR